jgi:hypothetical protein
MTELTSASGVSAGVSGVLVGSFVVGPSQSSRRDVTDGLQYYLLPGERLLIGGRVNSGAASEITVTIDWVEDI